ncbi:thiamine-phosphate kinase [Nitrosospira sp. NpAV]|uniref:thiamine-phosphate kinase n=1 Tax=Nitrosospira sp. NpAV TaxID=58133 RepID=UPI0005A26030|nr:thiamine-phosphate kinase [Nitrosospira sp. NpAV]KIO49503.1 thiamine monophosphate kinase [Nitrosospira sp. NpAV]
MPSEFDIIHRYFTRPAPSAVLGVGDDAALIKPASGMELAISTDMLVAGQHFFADADPCKLGYKSLAVNLSDMAAMGARPRWATLSLALPKPMVRTDEKWLKAFAEGFFGLAHTHQVDLVGGDTTCGPLTISVTILGEVAKGKALRRSGAKPGDDIWISGHLGDAALALAHEQQRIVLKPDEIAECLPALYTPMARVGLGQRLIGLAASAIDVSDGLLADLGHILKSSNVAAIIKMNDIRCSASMKQYLPQALAIECLLAGGDDYELCFTAPRSRRKKIEALSRDQEIALTRIGRIREGEGLLVLDAAGNTVTLETKGYDHFRV